MRACLLFLVTIYLCLCGGCRRKRVEPPPPPAPELPAADSAATVALPPSGAAMPPMTAEMMMKFEARFGRPPSNYTELSRLSTPPSPPPAR